MSRSRKKPWAREWIGQHSAKDDKRIANRIFRRRSRGLLRDGKEPLYSKHQAINQWDIGGDGKTVVGTKRRLRK